MRRGVCSVGLLVAAAAGLSAGVAGAQPRALLDAPRSEDVAVAGGEVLVAASASRGGSSLRAVPAAGGPARLLLDVRPPGPRWRSVSRVASSAQLTAALVAFIDPSGDFRDWQLYAGPPAGPLALVQRVRRTGSARVWAPIDVDVHGDRLLIQELRQPGFAFRLSVRAPDLTAPPVPQGRFGAPAAVAGEQIAWVGESGRADGRSFVRLVDWRTGRLSSSMELGRHSGDLEDRHLDLTDGGRVVAAIDGRLYTGAPGEPIHPLPGTTGAARLTAPRFAGARVAALARAPLEAQRPVLIDPEAGAARPLGPPSTALTAIAANEETVAWLANGCVVAADAAAPAPPPASGVPHAAAPPSAAATPSAAAPPSAAASQAVDALPPGACPRAEAALGEGGERLRGRTLRVSVACIAAPPPGCSGVVLLGRGGGWAGRGRFLVPAGSRRTVRVRMTPRGMAQVRRHVARTGHAFLHMTARLADGRVSREGAGAGSVLIERIG